MLCNFLGTFQEVFWMELNRIMQSCNRITSKHILRISQLPENSTNIIYLECCKYSIF